MVSTGGLYILPARDECVEAFQWLAQELRRAHGEALVMRVTRFEGLSDQDLITLFHEGRTQDYAELETQTAELEQLLGTASSSAPDVHDALARLQRRYSELRRVDYFDAPLGQQVAARLSALQRTLTPPQEHPVIAAATIAEYTTKQWVTRPRPHVDRLACIWLIRRFINPTAIIRYSHSPTADEITFDMTDGGHFGHVGNLCTFETVLTAFGFLEPPLTALAEIVHEIDVRDGLYTRPEIAGIDALLAGWQQENLSDIDLETRGIALFSGLYAALAHERKTGGGGR
ncbi:MAG: chromate resistance protein [Chloroflexota bacterium]|nr:chromate resistance protein [Chloroflexota bacterium]